MSCHTVASCGPVISGIRLWAPSVMTQWRWSGGGVRLATFSASSKKALQFRLNTQFSHFVRCLTSWAWRALISSYHYNQREEPRSCVLLIS